MEELSNKLNSGNPVSIVQILSKLVETIKNKEENDILSSNEFKFLKDKCICDNCAINIVAAEAILNIVRCKSANFVKSVITDFITIITTTKCSSNVVFLLNNLLLIDVQNDLSQKKSFKSDFNLRLPQHPFITMLMEDSNFWFAIFREITYSYKVADEKRICHYNELYKPIFLYTLCNPQGNFLLTFKQKLWTFLIENETDSVEPLLSWMQFENVDTVKINSEFLMELSDSNCFDANLLILWQTSMLHQMILHNFDPRALILSIFDNLENVKEKNIYNPVLLILSKSVSLCSSVYLSQLLKLCQVLISEVDCDVLTLNVIKATLLQWMSNPSSLLSESTAYAHSTFTLIESQTVNVIQNSKLQNFMKNFDHIITTNSDVYFAFQIYNTMESWKDNNDVVKWLDQLDNAPIFFTYKLFDFLVGLFLTKFGDTSINLKVFELILSCVEFNRNLSTNILTVILYKLTNTTDSKLHYHLLKALPKMAAHKDNLYKIISTIQALSKGQNTLKTFSTTLMMDLWKIDNKCYPYLEKLLIAPYSPSKFILDKWEFYVTRANVLKELCALKPELYGKEMVAHLSKILNECNTSEGAIPSALAIDGITLLCKSEIIDAVTTWATLAPLFKTEMRVPVIKSLCSLISEFPALSYTDAYPNLIEEVVAKLWEYLVLSPDDKINDEVWIAALDALTHFSVEQIVAQTPDDYFDEECLTIRKSGHVVPGHCWIHFLKNCSESKLKIAGDFLIKLITKEISGYLKFVYQVKGTREPVDYSYLPLNSVVRGISTFIKSQVLKWKNGVHKEVYLQCLRIFSQEYSKPLPPLDWCFLQELFHEPEAKNYCVNIAAHQVILSGTARRFVVNYIEALTQDDTNEDDVLLIYSNLKHLANSIQPFTLKPFLEVTISRAFELFKEGKEDYLKNIVEHLKVTLNSQEVQEANKVVIAEIISGYFIESGISTKRFNILLECVILFPIKCVDDISSPKSVKEIRSDWFKNAVRVRCYLAVNTDAPAPLNMLNEVVECGSSCPDLKHFIFKEFAAVFKKHKDNTECVLWILDLIGQIQALTAEKSEEKELRFLCDVFVLATIIFSGHFVFLRIFPDFKEMYQLFPRAIATLLDVNHWSICTTQALEWFHHMAVEKLFHAVYKDMFKRCLQSLRHESEFQKNMKWAKYLNIEC